MEWNGEVGFEVTNIYNHSNKHTVNLQNKSCTCREWDLLGIPCQHALAAINNNNESPEHYISHWYTKSTYMKAYSHSIQPVPGKMHWPETGKERIEPP